MAVTTTTDVGNMSLCIILCGKGILMTVAKTTVALSMLYGKCLIEELYKQPDGSLMGGNSRIALEHHSLNKFFEKEILGDLYCL